MTAASRHLAALSVGAALLVSAGCGSEEEKGEPLPADAVTAIDRRLVEVQRRYDAAVEDNIVGACQDIENDSYKVIDKTVEGLPDDVDEDVRDALEESVARLKDLTREGCSDVRPTRTEPEETTPPETEPPPTVTETVPPPAQTETAPQEKPKKPKENNGNGNGQAPGGTEVPGDTGGATPGAEEE